MEKSVEHNAEKWLLSPLAEARIARKEFTREQVQEATGRLNRLMRVECDISIFERQLKQQIAQGADIDANLVQGVEQGIGPITDSMLFGDMLRLDMVLKHCNHFNRAKSGLSLMEYPIYEAQLTPQRRAELVTALLAHGGGQMYVSLLGEHTQQEIYDVCDIDGEHVIDTIGEASEAIDVYAQYYRTKSNRLSEVIRGNGPMFREANDPLYYVDKKFLNGVYSIDQCGNPQLFALFHQQMDQFLEVFDTLQPHVQAAYQKALGRELTAHAASKTISGPASEWNMVGEKSSEVQL